MKVSFLFIIVILILLLMILRGIRRGLFGLIWGIASWILIAVVTVIAAPPFQTVLEEQTSIDERVHERIVEYIMDRSLDELLELESRLDDGDAGIRQTAFGAESVYRKLPPGASLQASVGDTIYLSSAAEIESLINEHPELAEEAQRLLEEDPQRLQELLESVQDGASENVQDAIDAVEGLGIDASEIIGQYGGDIQSLLERYGGDWQSLLENYDLSELLSSFSFDTLREQIAGQVADAATSVVMRGISVLIIFVVMVLLTQIIGFIVRRRMEESELGVISHVLGGVWGLLEGLLLCWIILFAVSCFSILPAGKEIVEQQIDANLLLDFLYYHNPLAPFCRNMLGLVLELPF